MYADHIFQNRKDAGRALAEDLRMFAGRPDTIVLALPRGGVPVAFEVAKALHLPLDLFLVRKLGVPWQPELAFGAIAIGGFRVLDQRTIEALRLSPETIEMVAERELKEVKRREELYRSKRPAVDARGKTVIVVDDGLATGATMRAAIEALKEMGPGVIVAAAPVASSDTCRALASIADVICICSTKPSPFYGVGMWYRDFPQTTDEEVRTILAEADKSEMAAHSS